MNIAVYSKIYNKNLAEKIISRNFKSNYINRERLNILKETGIILGEPLADLFDTCEDFIMFSEINNVGILLFLENKDNFLYGDLNGGIYFTDNGIVSYNPKYSLFAKKIARNNGIDLNNELSSTQYIKLKDKICEGIKEEMNNAKYLADIVYVGVLN